MKALAHLAALAIAAAIVWVSQPGVLALIAMVALYVLIVEGALTLDRLFSEKGESEMTEERNDLR